MNDAGYYTFPQLCKTYGASAVPNPIFPVARSTFQLWIKSGLIPPPKSFAHRKVWPKKQIHELLEQIEAGEHPLSGGG